VKKTSFALGALLALAACGDKDSPKTPPGPSPSAPPGTGTTSDHAGQNLDLGRLTIAGHELAVTRLGDLVPGREGAFEVSLGKGPAGADLAKLNVYAWVEEQGGTQVSAPTKGSLEKGKLHFHVTPRADAGAPVRLVLRLRADGGIDERASLPLDGHGHEHGATPHDGVVAAFKGPDGQVAGHLELKLHDDKGDLELWIAKDAKIAQPMDVALDTVVHVTFIDFEDRTVEMRVRNKGRNEDEEGAPNVRSGRTNYFIFPGDSGQDAAWLTGTKFQSVVRVTLTADGRAYTSEELVLVPHTHADGSTHK
jgi:hypothetical protein